uniref:EF-hand domain-containing protein n=1 Tax=Cryptomonas curvata TaxID=233186 RepID=A0A6T7Y8C5_9CRYP
MNLFVGMIIKNFVCCLDQEDSFLHIEDLRMISDIWTRIYDQQGSGFIPLHSIGRLLLDVPKPLGITGIQSKRKTYLCIREDLRRSCLHHSQSKCTEESLRSNEGYDRLGVRQFFHFLLRVEVYLASFIWKIPKITNSSALSSSNQEDGDLDGSTDVELECHGKTESREFTTKSVDEREDDALGNSGDFEFLEMLTGRSIHGPNSNTEIALSPDTFEENGSQVSVLVEMDINGNVLSRPSPRDALNITAGQELLTPEKVSSSLILGLEVGGAIVACRPDENEPDATNVGHSSGSEQDPLPLSQSGLSDAVESDVKHPIGDIQTSSEHGGNSTECNTEDGSNHAGNLTECNTEDGLKTQDLDGPENHVEVQLHDDAPPQRSNLLIQVFAICCLYCVAGLRWILSLFLSRQAMQTHKMHQIRFDKVVNSMIYWNNQQDVVPLNLVESRKIYDESIVRLAARDIVVAFMRGLLERRKLRLVMRAPTIIDESLSNQKESNDDMNYDFIPAVSVDHATLKHHVELILEYGYGRNLRMAANQRGHNLISVSEMAYLSVSQILEIFDDDNIRIILDFVLAKHRQRNALEEMSAEISAIQSQTDDINLDKEKLVIELHSIQESTLKLKHELDRLKSKDLEHKLGSYAAQNSWKDKTRSKKESKDLVDSGKNSDTKIAHFHDVKHSHEENGHDLSTSQREAFSIIDDVGGKKAGEQFLVERRFITSKKVEQEINQRRVELENLEKRLARCHSESPMGSGVDVHPEKDEQAKERRALVFDPTKTASTSTALALIDSRDLKNDNGHTSGDQLRQKKQKPSWL